MKTLICIAPDGACVREGEFDTVAQAWARNEDMGSRWYFYPFRVVTGAAGKSPNARIVSVPYGLDAAWRGRTLGNLCGRIAALPEAEIALAMNDGCLLLIAP